MTTLPKPFSLPKKRILLCCVFLFLSAFLLYSGSLSNKFAFDDKSIIVDSRYFHDGVSISEIFSTNYRAGIGFRDDGLYRPLVILSLLWNNFDRDPMPFHLVNVFINAINSVLLFLLFFLLIRSLNVAFLSAVLFTFHPIHTEAVANIAGRPELLCAMFFFSAWIIRERLPHSMMGIVLSSLSIFFSLLSKETAVVFLFTIITVDWIRGYKITSKHSLLEYGFYAAILIVYFVIRWSVLGETASGQVPEFINNPLYYSTLVGRLATAFSIFFLYLYLLVFPFHLSADYSYNQLHLYQSFDALLPLAGIVIFIAFLIIAVKLRNNFPAVTLAVCFFLYPYLIISNIPFPIGTIMGERLMYLPSSGFTLAVGFLFSRWMTRKKISMFIFVSVILFLFTVKTVIRSKEWYDDLTVFTAAEKTSTKSAKVFVNLGYLWGERGDMRKGEEYYHKALDIYPEFSDALSGLGKNLYDQRRLSESLVYYKKALEVESDKPERYYDYAIVLEKSGMLKDAEFFMDKAITMNPRNAKFIRGMGNIKLSLQQFKEAIQYFRQAIDLGDEKRINLNNITVAWYSLGEFNEALKTITEAESLNIHLHPEMVKTIKEMTAGK